MQHQVPTDLKVRMEFIAGADKLLKTLPENSLWDIRTTEERRLAPIPGTLHFPYEMFSDNFPAIQPWPDPIAIFCPEIERAHNAAAIIRKRGYAGQVIIVNGFPGKAYQPTENTQ